MINIRSVFELHQIEQVREEYLSAQEFLDEGVLVFSDSEHLIDDLLGYHCCCILVLGHIAPPELLLHVLHVLLAGDYVNDLLFHEHVD